MFSKTLMSFSLAITLGAGAGVASTHNNDNIINSDEKDHLTLNAQNIDKSEEEKSSDLKKKEEEMAQQLRDQLEKIKSDLGLDALYAFYDSLDDEEQKEINKYCSDLFND